MIISNIRTPADLEAKKKLQKELLDLEVANQAVLQERRKTMKVSPPSAQTIQAQYRTSAEMAKDKGFQEQLAKDNFMDIGFDFATAGQLVAWLGSPLINRLVEFNSTAKTIKKELKDNYDIKIMTPDFVKNYLEQFFDELDLNYGRKMSSSTGAVGAELPVDVENLMAILPAEDSFVGLTEALEGIRASEAGKMFEEKIDIATRLLSLYQNLLPNKQVIDDLTFGLTQQERGRVVKKYGKVVSQSQFITKDEMFKIQNAISRGLGKPDTFGKSRAISIKSIDDVLNRLIRQLYVITQPEKIKQMQEINRDILKYGEKNPEFNTEAMKDRIELADKTYRETVADLEKLSEASSVKQSLGKIIEREEKRKEEIAKERGRETAENMMMADEEQLMRDVMRKEEAEKERKRKIDQRIIDTIDEISGLSNNDEQRKVYLKQYVQSVFPDIDLPSTLSLTLEEYKNKVFDKLTKKLYEDTSYDPFSEEGKRKSFEYKSANQRRRGSAGTELDITTGVGLRAGAIKEKIISKLRKHFREDEGLLRTIAHAIEKAQKEVDEESSSSSDSEIEKELSRHIKASKKPDAIIEKAVKGDEIGVGFKAKKIPLKKVGRGVSAEDTPTYREFGKYIVHIPHLLDNTANFKYPSKGSIPSIKPQTISEDYKNFLIDVLNTGKMNDTVYKHLPQSEIKHFERVVKGAGLAEKLGLKPSHTEQDKKDAERFEVLKGEVLAGNNAESVLKELRMLIVKFMNEGRLHKAEATNMLMTLATL